MIGLPRTRHRHDRGHVYAAAKRHYQHDPGKDDWNPQHPYWRLSAWLQHGPRSVRDELNRKRRRANKIRVRMGFDPLPWRRDAPREWW